VIDLKRGFGVGRSPTHLVYPYLEGRGKGKGDKDFMTFYFKNLIHVLYFFGVV
jgi:hypothetical protein